MARKKKIEKLTDEQEKMVAEIRDKWIALGTMCKPADRAMAEEGIRLAYKNSKLEPPTDIRWADSPMAGAKEAARISTGKNEPSDEQVRRQVDNAIWGQHDAGSLAFCEAFEKLGISDKARGLCMVGAAAGWWWAFDGIAVVSERPLCLHRDEQGRLHCEDGPAIAYPDGFAIYAINGVRLPEYIIMRPEEITVEKIRSERNAEIKRIMRERYGEGRYLADIGAKVLDVDSIAVDKLAPRSQSIQRALIEDDEGNRWLVGSDGSTKRVYHMRVPNESQTCTEAHMAICGFSEQDIILEA